MTEVATNKNYIDTKMADTPEEILKDMKKYWLIGWILLACTVLTVVVAWITPSITTVSYTHLTMPTILLV